MAAPQGHRRAAPSLLLTTSPSAGPSLPSPAPPPSQLSLDKGVAPKDMLEPAFLSHLAQHEAAKRHNAMAAEAAGY